MKVALVYTSGATTAAHSNLPHAEMATRAAVPSVGGECGMWIYSVGTYISIQLVNDVILMFKLLKLLKT